MSKKRIPKALTHEEILMILSAISNKGYRGKWSRFNRIRNIMMFTCALNMGLRPREVYNAKLKNIDLEKGSWFIPKEDNKQRFSDDMPIPEHLLISLKKYLAFRNRYYPYSRYMFPTNSKQNRMERSYYDKLFRDALKVSGIYKVSYIDGLGNKRANHTPYSCRHTFCTNAYMKLKDIKKVSILARHKDIAMRTTSLYIHCIEDDMREDIMHEMYDQNL